jgi:hypothetical protein
MTNINIFYVYDTLTRFFSIPLCIIILIAAASINIGFSSSANMANKTNTSRPFVQFETSRPQYMSGAVIIITGHLHNRSGDLPNGKVTINISKNNNIFYSESTYTTNGKFQFNFTDIQDPGDYLITASLNDNIVKGNSIHTIHIKQIQDLPIFYILLVGALSSSVALFFLLFWISEHKHNYTRTEHFETAEILRFIFISGISLSPILAFITANVEVGINIGLVIREPVDQYGKPQVDTKGLKISQWIIHVGGTASNNYATGVNIPFYVVMFGILGGYLRYY